MSEDKYDNQTAFEKCYKALVKQSLDVQFIFGNDNDTIKVPANKVVLAALSPVFNAMFNGELKENGNVKITDASPEAFQEFLQFFHDSQVKLTMENIAEVLILIGKYDVPDCFAVCSDFLKKNMKIDDIFWLLHLAVEFHLDDLKRFCGHMIQKNCRTVFDMISFDGEKLRITAADHARQLEADELEKIYPHIIALSKNVMSNMADEMDLSLLPITLTTEKFTNCDYVTYHANNIIEFTLNGNMLLTDIFFSKTTISHSFTVSITKKPDSNSKSLLLVMLTVKFIQSEKTRIELKPPLQIEPNQIYTITCNPHNGMPNGLRTQQSNIPHGPVEFSPGVTISFPQDNRKYVCSLISKLYFQISD